MGWHTAGCIIGGGAAVVISAAWLIDRFCRPRRPAPVLLPTSTSSTPATSSQIPPPAPAPAHVHAPPAPDYGPPPYAPYGPYPYPYQNNTYIIESSAGGDGIGAAIAANAAGAACRIM